MTPKFLDEFEPLDLPHWEMSNLHNLISPKEIKTIKLIPKIIFRQILPDCEVVFIRNQLRRIILKMKHNLKKTRKLLIIY